MPSRKTVFTAGGVVAALVIIFVITMILRGPSPPSAPKPILGTFDLPKAFHWDESRQCLFFVDVYNSTIHKYVPSTNTHTSGKVGTEPVAFIIPINGTTDRFIISYGAHLAMVTWNGKNSSKKVESKVWVPLGNDVYRANEGRVSPSGSLFVGGHSPFAPDHSIVPGKAALYAVDKDTRDLKIVIPNVTVANGMAWSKNGTVFYFIDSLEYTLTSFSYNKVDDSLSNKDLLINFKEAKIEGIPDGMTIDSEDTLWITMFRGAKVIHFDPASRKVLQEIDLDAYLVTSAAFGGPSLKDFYVSTGTYNLRPTELKTYPHSGYLFEQKSSPAVGRPNINFAPKVME